MSKDSLKIRDLNDRFRKGDRTVPGDVFITQGLHAMINDEGARAASLINSVRTFEEFTPDNDPWGEHDFGSFMFEGNRCFWKIDVLDPSLEMAPLDATDPTLSHRVLTIMLASEY